MAEASKVVLRNLRIAPRKVRLVVNLVKGKPVQYALDLLKVTNKRAAPVVYKMIQSAVANATNKSPASGKASESDAVGGAVLSAGLS